jgi:dCMP deaminase
MSRDKMLMDVASVVSERGTCSRLQVGVVISRDGRIIVTGYNGAPAGIDHCNHTCDCGFPGNPNMPNHTEDCAKRQPCTVSSHAEQNAIAFAAKHGLALDQSELHVTHGPCLACARSIINAGIRKVTYVEEFRDSLGVKLLHRAGVEVVDEGLGRR